MVLQHYKFSTIFVFDWHIDLFQGWSPSFHLGFYGRNGANCWVEGFFLNLQWGSDEIQKINYTIRGKTIPCNCGCWRFLYLKLQRHLLCVGLTIDLFFCHIKLPRHLHSRGLPSNLIFYSTDNLFYIIELVTRLVTRLITLLVTRLVTWSVTRLVSRLVTRLVNWEVTRLVTRLVNSVS